MGYACPVCASPQPDAEHLANHLAFAAMLRGGDHEAWLDERVPDWADRDPAALGAEVVERAGRIDHETVFDDATEGGSGPPPVGDALGRTDARQSLGPEARRILDEAIELTRERRGDEDA